MGVIVETHDWITSDDIVVFQGKLYKVIKLNPANYRAIDQQGRLWNLRRTPAVKRASDDQAKQWDTGAVMQEDPLEIVRVGSVVRWKQPSPKTGGQFVVIKDKGGEVSLVRLGGDLQSRYFPTVPRALLTLVKGEFTGTNV